MRLSQRPSFRGFPVGLSVSARSLVDVGVVAMRFAVGACSDRPGTGMKSHSETSILSVTEDYLLSVFGKWPVRETYSTSHVYVPTRELEANPLKLQNSRHIRRAQDAAERR
ncbi:hypothetical protein EVAR_76686_1 [Eumeta japonica]|uniref:Uncharacterized protein n=1 Tax=Eumeta variegata TaxID=151549 RepID=A0A4C1STD5_EUMVA|nr:hypothetical protein EVAR_76686_1 [Eumeta japonica]